MKPTKHQKNLIGTVIPCHNRRALTLQCLSALRTIYTSNFDLRLYVVDDCSADGTSLAIQQRFANSVNLLKGDGKLFWTGGVNMGVRRALEEECTHILLMNDDIEFEPNFLDALYQEAVKTPKAIVAALTLDQYDRRSVIRAGAIRSTTKRPFFRGIIIELANRHDRRELQEVDWASARAMLIPAEVFYKVGLFDQKRFPHAMSDLEFCIRAKKAGYCILVNSKSVIYTRIENKFANRLLTNTRFKAIYDLWLDDHHFGIRLIYHFSSVFFPGRLGYLLFHVLMYTKWSLLKLLCSKQCFKERISHRVVNTMPNLTKGQTH